MGQSHSKRRVEIPLVILGLDNAGKTTIVNKLNDLPIDQIKPTESFNKTSLERGKILLKVIDVGGQSKLRYTWRTYLSGVGALIFVVDSADKERMDEAYGELLLLLEEVELRSIPLLIFANKQDIKGALTPTEIYKSLQLQLIRDRAWQLYPCSALNGTGLEDGIKWIEKFGKKM